MAQPEETTGKLADSVDESIYINEADGLTNEHPILPYDIDEDEEEVAENPDAPLRPVKKRATAAGDADDSTFDDLPTSLIVTNIHSEVFTDETQRAELEELFRFFSAAAKFQWFRSFRRLRVNYDTAVAAATARIQLQQYQCGKSRISCYFAQPVTPVTQKYLQPPAPYKQFLISPPASPPLDWQPHEEGEPVVNQDLLAALANLTPGESHELHPPSTEHPAIVVHTANLSDTDADDDGDDEANEQNGSADETEPIFPAHQRIMQTRCPERT